MWWMFYWEPGQDTWHQIGEVISSPREALKTDLTVGLLSQRPTGVLGFMRKGDGSFERVFRGPDGGLTRF